MVCAYLEKICQEYQEKKETIDKIIGELEVELKENIEGIRLLEQNDDEDCESFFPRDRNTKNKAKIQELKEKQEEIIKRTEDAKLEQSELVHEIDELHSVIEEAKINEKKLLEVEKKAGNNISKLSILEIQENERQRISRELHDSTVQNLTGMVHKTELCSKLMEIDPIRCKLELTMMSRTLRDIINDTRQMIYNLRPMSFDDIGLDITIERAIDKMKNEKGCNISFSVDGESYFIHPVVGITLLRIVQEACNNAVKYAEADVISVKMIYKPETVEIIISDDGKGFDTEHLNIESRSDNSGFGLSMMRERVYLLSGEIDISSQINVGTVVKVSVPIYKKE